MMHGRRFAGGFAANLLLFVLLATGATAQRDLPPLAGIVHYGYTVEQGSDGFRGTVWAQYRSPTPEWKQLYTIQKSRAQAVRDCEGWMDRMDKAFRKAARGQNHAALSRFPEAVIHRGQRVALAFRGHHR